ncbi:hypothetical protein [Lichenicoccus sp.]|uniref:hypothetical protein n=1 Tax=Lichenicoccus sp. TaxID=2781899 RepID=UPI003D0C8DE6
MLSEGELVECAWSPAFAADPVDVVLLDLAGSVPVLLDLIGRLRATLRPDVAFVGILPAAVDPVARIYLSAVVDALVDEPASGTNLIDAVRDALAEREGMDLLEGRTMSLVQTRH